MAAREINRGCWRTGITCTTERAGFNAALNSRMRVIALSAGGFLIAGFLRDHHHASVFDAALGDDVVCGAEIGLRTKLVPKLESSVGLFLLDSASETLFSGDAGDTSASRPSRRYDVEWTNDYRPLSWLSLEGDVAATHARSRSTTRRRPRSTLRWQASPLHRAVMHSAIRSRERPIWSLRPGSGLARKPAGLPLRYPYFGPRLWPLSASSNPLVAEPYRPYRAKKADRTRLAQLNATPGG
jgi:hypothetical protein